MTRAARNTEAMDRTLANLAEGRSSIAGVFSMHQLTALSRTMDALRSRGFVDVAGVITDAGRDYLAEKLKRAQEAAEASAAQQDGESTAIA